MKIVVTSTYSTQSIPDEEHTYKFNFSFEELMLMTAEDLANEVNEMRRTKGHSDLNQPSIDGVGMQFNFIIDGIPYLIAGPRWNGALCSVIGGKIASDSTLIDQLAEELYEETFGVFQFLKDPSSETYLQQNGRFLIKCNLTQQTLEIEFETQEMKCSIDDDVNWSMDYLTIPCNIHGLELSDLKSISEAISPTAKLWNTIGGQYFGLMAPQYFNGDWEEDHWNTEEIVQKRNQAKINIQNLYEELVAENHEILVDPSTVFNSDSFESALAEIFDHVPDANAFRNKMNNQIGNYSERPYYKVFFKHALIDSINLEVPVLDIDGNEGPHAVFDSKAVMAIHKPVSKYAPSIESLENIFSSETILLLDNDGTLFNSQVAEAPRILKYLQKLSSEGEILPNLEELEAIGYGHKVWADGLCQALKESFPSLSEKTIKELQKLMSQDEADEEIIAMGEDMRLLSGVKIFLENAIDSDAVIGIATDNYPLAVKKAVNTHLGDLITCMSPDEGPINDKRTIFINDTHGVDTGFYKPDPTKLLMQQFSGFLRLGYVHKEQAQQFSANEKFRESIQAEARNNGIKTVYIGDSKSDLLAAHNANFDLFIAVINTGRQDGYHQFIKVAEEIKANTNLEIIMIEDFDHLNQVIASAQKRLINSDEYTDSFFAPQELGSMEKITQLTASAGNC